MDILVENIDVDLLREQRGELIELLCSNGGARHGSYKVETIDGVINLLDCMLDVAEGFTIDLTGGY